MQVLADKVNRKSMFIGVGCMFFQQTSGINMIVFYMSYIFEVTESSISPQTASISVGVVQVSIDFMYYYYFILYYVIIIHRKLKIILLIIITHIHEN